MKTIAILNLKGGVAKTVSAVNIAHILATLHGKRVLLIDDDKQGNASKFFGLHDEDLPGMADVLTQKNCPLQAVVRATRFEGLDVLPANMHLLRANKQVLLDSSRPQQNWLAKFLEQASGIYDFAIIDNAPDLDMGVINALCACDDVLIPIKVDNFAFDGLDVLLEQVEEIRALNPKIRVAGCFVTMFAKNLVNVQGMAHLESRGIPFFKTPIRKTVKVDETTFAGVPLFAYSPSCTAAKDYVALVAEYLDRPKL